jgi:hypothetical protein
LRRTRMPRSPLRRTTDRSTYQTGSSRRMRGRRRQDTTRWCSESSCPRSSTSTTRRGRLPCTSWSGSRTCHTLEQGKPNRSSGSRMRSTGSRRRSFAFATSHRSRTHSARTRHHPSTRPTPTRCRSRRFARAYRSCRRPRRWGRDMPERRRRPV